MSYHQVRFFVEKSSKISPTLFTNAQYYFHLLSFPAIVWKLVKQSRPEIYQPRSYFMTKYGLLGIFCKFMNDLPQILRGIQVNFQFYILFDEWK